MNYYDFLEGQTARLFHRLPRTIVSSILKNIGRLGLLSNSDFIPHVIEKTQIAKGAAAWKMASEIQANEGDNFTDFGALMYASEKQIISAYADRVRIENIEYWHEVAGKPFIVVGAHFACFYLSMFASGILNRITIIRRFHSPGRDILIDRLCSMTSKKIDVIGLTDPAVGMKIIKQLKSGVPVAGMMDYSYTDTSTFISPFMGFDSATPAGLPIIAAKLKLPLLPLFVMRENNAYVVKIGAPIIPISVADPFESAYDITCKINSYIEQAIRLTPTQWTFWPSLPSRWVYAEAVAEAEENNGLEMVPQ